MHHLSDVELVEQAQNGRITAVGELYDRYQRRIYRYVRSRVYDHQRAEDLTGEIFLRMVAHIDGYRPMNVPFAAWLFRIARNYLINASLKEKPGRYLPLSSADTNLTAGGNPSLIVEKKLTMAEVTAALAEIDEVQREVIRLRFLVGLSLQETAVTLNRTVAAVKSSQHRGLKTLKAILSRPSEI